MSRQPPPRPGIVTRSELLASPGYHEPDGGDPRAVIECVEEIPCNPCEQACPRGAITIGSPITRLPVLHTDKCTGCGLCVAGCPGQAIFIVTGHKPGGKAEVGFPYEHPIMPEAGQIVTVVDRAGESVGTGLIMRIQNSARNDRTAVIFVEVDRELAHEVRSIMMRKGGPNNE